MKESNHNITLNLLQTIMEFELAGVVRYTHYSLVVNSSYNTFIVDFLKEQASESLTHAQKVGEMLTSLDGYPRPRIALIEDGEKYSVKDVLIGSLAHEKKALELYKQLLLNAKNSNDKLEEFARNMIEEEGSHHIQLEEMIRDL
ncbi:MAG: ferritin-like domain-containing protein [Gloeotrichia echinulata GP01]